MNLPLMALLLVLLLGVWLILRLRKRARDESSRPLTSTGATTSAHHAVSINFSSNACKPARELAGRRFLAAAAPRLPLTDCDVLECKCRFIHHKDRRSGKDRRSPFAPSGFGGGTGQFEQELRTGKDRRAGDDEDLF
jgi:hypothetical protein